MSAFQNRVSYLVYTVFYSSILAHSERAAGQAEHQFLDYIKGLGAFSDNMYGNCYSAVGWSDIEHYSRFSKMGTMLPIRGIYLNPIFNNRQICKFQKITGTLNINIFVIVFLFSFLSILG